MEISLEKVQSPLRKLRKSLKRLPDNPSIEGVHKLRTHTRRVEAVSFALMKDHEGKTRALLKAVKPMRKAAGQVRDMDVLINNVLSLPHDQESDSRVRLVEHLSEARSKSTRKLLDTVEGKRKSASRNLKRYEKLAGKWLQNGNDATGGPTAAPVDLAGDLGHWPKFSKNNIHPFRIKLKELRYTLQLSPHADEKLLATMDEVKDAIGEWHDWSELHQIAAKVLSAKADRSFLVRISEMEKHKLTKALEVANNLRKEYLAPRASGPGKKPPARVLVVAQTANGVDRASA